MQIQSRPVWYSYTARLVEADYIVTLYLLQLSSFDRLACGVRFHFKLCIVIASHSMNKTICVSKVPLHDMIKQEEDTNSKLEILFSFTVVNKLNRNKLDEIWKGPFKILRRVWGSGT
jgi:hypothetical protein